PRSAPIANDTSVETQLARSSSANAASPAESVPPTKLAARIQPSVMVMGRGILLGQPAERSREPYIRGHAPTRAVAPLGKEAQRIEIGAVAPAKDALHSARRQALPSHCIKVEQPMPWARRRERRLRRRVARDECRSDFVADFVHLRPDGGAEP